MSVSIDSSRDANNDDLKLKNMIVSDDMDIDEQLQKKEESNSRHSKLMDKLSTLEKSVFELYVERYRYEEIVEILTDRGMEVNVKVVDNSLYRVKNKGRDLAKKLDFQAENRGH